MTDCTHPFLPSNATTDHARSTPSNRRGLIALAAGSFGIGLTEFVIMGLLPQVARSLDVGIASAGLLVAGYALGVVFGGPVLTLLTARASRKMVLLMLMGVFTIGNLACALAPTYTTLMLARIVTGFAHGTFFGVGAIVAQQLVPPERKGSAIALMFTGLTLANVLGVPFGTWIGHAWGWRATFLVICALGLLALAAIALWVPRLRVERAPRKARTELAAMLGKGPLLGFAMTVLGFAGVFLLFTYIAPVLTRMSGFADSAVAPLLLLFGIGLVGGNLAGGWLADRNLRKAVLGTLLALAATLIVSRWAFCSMPGVALAIAMFGAVAFGTVAPLQAWTIRQARGADEALASTFNISAFNLGNAIGAWIGGLVLSAGWGLPALFFVAAVPPGLAAAIAFLTIEPETTP
ncbi:MFS transporter [Citromicrobium sp. JLT1363]|uniref:MFS transporter n=1 Tax=Citromicrobium sp. JLT1363 TaxID=517722 RepID=UPI000225E278|nr:MFS transporter [Citromicrobium sp. JLT1363]